MYNLGVSSHLLNLYYLSIPDSIIESHVWVTIIQCEWDLRIIIIVGGVRIKQAGTFFMRWEYSSLSLFETSNQKVCRIQKYSKSSQLYLLGDGPLLPIGTLQSSLAPLGLISVTGRARQSPISLKGLVLHYVFLYVLEVKCCCKMSMGSVSC